MARVLARDYGANVVVVARREARLQELAEELKLRHGVQVEVFAADLCEEDAAEAVFQRATSDRVLHGAILNAGITHFGDWDEQSWEDFQRMQALNVTSVVQLSRRLLRYFEQRGEGGGLMLVSSMVGLTPTAYQTAYSATKAFLVHYGCGLHHEMASRGVSVTTFCPGGIETEMTSDRRFNDLRGWLMPADRCARGAVKALVDREYVRAPGLLYRVGTVLTRWAPQRFLHGQVAAQYRKSLEKNR